MNDSQLSNSQRDARIRWAVGAAAAVIIFAWLLWPKPPREEPHVNVGTVDVPVVMHTSGGRLEVATVTATEAFELDAPPKDLLGIDLGRTFSHLQAKVVYRFHIEMAKEWPITLQGATAVVEAGEIKPTLPVAFDTTTMRKESASGWARFDKHENMDDLERRLSPELERRAYGYKGLALESARKSVGDFVQKWLIKEQHWQEGARSQVKVVFPGEPLPTEATSPSNGTSQ